MIFERLKEERKRLGYSQEAFAAVAGITRRPYAEWETGNTSPSAVQLAALAAAGLDVLYVVVGTRSGQQPDAAEQVLLQSYRACSDQARQKLITQAALLSAGIDGVAAGQPPATMSNVGDGNVQASNVEGGISIGLPARQATRKQQQK